MENKEELKDAEITLESIEDEKLPFGIVEEEIEESSDEDVSNKDK